MTDEIVVSIVRAKTLYEVLQVSKIATKQEITKQYKRLSIRVHPDKCRHAKAEDALKKLNEAHRILSNDRTREQYDVTGSTHDRPPPSHSHYSNYSQFDRHADPFFFFFAEAARQQEFFRQQQHRGRGRRSRDPEEEYVGSTFKFAWFPIVLLVVLLFGGPLLQGIPTLLETLAGAQYEFTYSSTFPFEHKTRQGGVRYFVGPEFDASIFMDDSTRQAFEKDIIKKWALILDDKCKLERIQRDRLIYADGQLRRTDAPTPSCTELTRLSHLRR